jgi:hypothetical protein
VAVFPSPTIELLLDGVWTDITDDVYVRDSIVITVGQSGEGARAEASRCSLTINNRAGDYSPRNPNGAYFGVLGRNTQLRVTAGETDTRFVGEVASWPQRWDTTGEDVWVPIEAGGVTRRLGQGASPLKSVLYRALTTLTTPPKGYWPMEDGSSATEFASGLPGGEAASGAAAATLATFSGFKASAPLPEMQAARVGCNVGAYSHTGEHQTRFLLRVPSGGVAAETSVVRIYTATGQAAWWELRVKADGALILRAVNSEGADLFNSGPMGFDVNNKHLRVSVELEDAGAGVTDWNVLTLQVGAATGLSLSGSTAAGVLGAVRRVGVNSEGGLGATAFGHLSVQDTITSLYDLHEELNAYTGETAGDRISRLLSEEGIPQSVIGTLAESTALGPQLPRTLLDLLHEAADADGGILYDPGWFLGLVYRTRGHLYAQAAALELDYAAGHLSAIEPVDDDQATRNDITVTREGGGSARAELTEGALSTAAPPDGVGRYDEEVTISVERDEDLAHQASWRLHMGTVDEARYPVLGVNLGAEVFMDDEALSTSARLLDVGGKVTVANPPAWLPPEAINQLALGYTETIRPPSGVPYRHPWTIDINCAPASPYDVGVYDDSTGPGEARYSSDGSSLAEDLDATEQTIEVATVEGPLWSDADQPFDILIGGERMTVTDVTAGPSPQFFTVTRSVNGVVKTHLTGAEVRLFKPAYYAL